MNRKKGYYIYTCYEGQSLGVQNKMQAQVDCFIENGIECTLLPVIKKTSPKDKVLFRLPWGSDNVNWPNPEMFSECDYLYFRRNMFTSRFSEYLSSIRRINPNIKIFIEIPTYPYDKELLQNQFFSNVPLLIKDMVGRRKLKNYIDFFVVIGRVGRTLWGTPVIKMYNGVKLENFEVRLPSNETKSINILMVANFARYHGADIFIRGLAQYYKTGGKRDVQLYLVGPIDNLREELQLVENNAEHVKRHVNVLGIKKGEELRRLYNFCDAGIVSLGYHRLGLTYNTTIKSKEYLAVGMPIICDTLVDILEDEKCGYVHYTEYGEKSTNISKIIEFYDKIYPNGKLEEKRKVAQEIREKYSNRINYDETMQEIIERIKGE